MDNFDQAIIDAYFALGESVDRIACFKPIRDSFLQGLPLDTRTVADDDLIWRLMQLRKTKKLAAKHLEN